MTFRGIVVNVFAEIIELVVAIAIAEEEKYQYSDYPILTGIVVACVWAIVKILVNHVVIYG